MRGAGQRGKGTEAQRVGIRRHTVSEPAIMAATIRDFRDLVVWQKAMTLVELIYEATRQFPKEELYGLTNQIRRAAVSIPSNIAEGQARKSTAEFRNFLSIAQGSRAEVETQTLIAIRLNYLQQASATPILSLLEELSKMLAALQARLH